MNFRRGFHRIWFVLSCLWWTVLAIAFFSADKPVDGSHMFYMALVPPVAILFVGRVFSWVFGGFRPDW